MKSIENFLSKNEIEEILSYSDSCKPSRSLIENPHIKEVNDHINGFSVLNDMTKTELSSYVAKFQGDSTCVDGVPQIFHDIKDRISLCGIDKKHVFFQLIVMNSGGEVRGHYDAAVPGYITYKCNIPIVGPEIDTIFIDKQKMFMKTGELYCFEANLFKHWMESSEHKRVLLSYGFLVPYVDLGWSESSPRVRMSNRIWEKFISRK